MTGYRIRPVRLENEQIETRNGGLSPKEQLTLELVVAGHWYQGLPRLLTLSKRRVEGIIHQLYEKTGVCGRMELCMYGERNGFGKMDWIAWDARPYAIQLERRAALAERDELKERYG